MTGIAEHLEYYLDLGFCLIPALPRSKQPAIPWKVYQSRRPTAQELDGWRRLWDRGYNIAVVLGAISVNTVCVDFDNPEVIRRLPLEELRRKTMTVLTGGDKLHVYVRTPRPVRTVKFPSVGVEVRGEGSISILPNSIHPSGKQYVLLSRPGELAVMEDPVLEVMGAFRIPGSERGSNPGGSTGFRRFREPPPCWRTLLSPGTFIYEGWRNEACCRVASRFLQDGLPVGEIMERVWRWNLEHCVPPLSRSEVESAVRSVVRHGYAYGCTGMASFCDIQSCPLANEVHAALRMLEKMGASKRLLNSTRTLLDT